MNRISKHIPNALTCCNLVSGCMACIVALEGSYLLAMIYIFIAVGFDFADGLAARLLNAYSPIGKDLDSLADMVSFGVAPGMMLFHFINNMLQVQIVSDIHLSKLFYIPAFVIPVFSALRLAKFNNDTRQTTSFIGLPVPAHALFWSSLLCVFVPSYIPLTVRLPEMMFPLFPEIFLPVEPFILLIGFSILALATSLLMVSEIPMFSLKIKSPAWKGNEQRYVLVLSAVILILCLGIAGITVTILLYILLSVFNKRNTLPQQP